MAMADGHAQASGSLSAVSLHLAPGLGNAMGMLYNAHKAASPVLLLVGQHEQSFATTEPILSGDVAGMARPLLKWAGEVPRLRDLPRMLHRAAKTAMAPPTGPVLLSLPQDVLIERDEIDLQEPTRVAARVRGDAVAIAAAGALLSAAQRPVIVVGDAVAQSRAHAELVELAELLGAPVYAELSPAPPRFPPRIRCFMARSCRARRSCGRCSSSTTCCSIGADLFHCPCCAGRRDPERDARRAHRCRSVAAGKELSRRGGHPRRCEGDACGSERRAARGHDERRPP